jgi:hypothetical protein
MAQLTNQQFEDKYDVLFRDNNIQNITEKTFRDFKTDLKDSYANLKALNVRQVKGATYPVPYTDSLNLIPPAYRILSMSALARNGQTAAAAATSAPAPPVTFTLVANSGGTIDALTDEQPDTTTTVKAVWVRQSGTTAQVIDSFPAFVARNPDGSRHPYEVGDKFKYLFPSGPARLFEVRKYQNVVSNPLPTGLESDPNYRPFAPLSDSTPTGSGGAASLYTDTYTAEVAGSQTITLPLTAVKIVSVGVRNPDDGSLNLLSSDSYTFDGAGTLQLLDSAGIEAGEEIEYAWLTSGGLVAAPGPTTGGASAVPFGPLPASASYPLPYAATSLRAVTVLRGTTVTPVFSTQYTLASDGLSFTMNAGFELDAGAQIEGLLLTSDTTSGGGTGGTGGGIIVGPTQGSDSIQVISTTGS